ncbi:MAG: glycosyltransferase family 2 protein [Candidatus Zixiibacteriota bacterium]|nr:MAG: glycosyltransferase family 2 protein [candidate division Zixibacteria bacterium]
MPNLSAVVITRNEEANIKRCLLSLQIADEIIVVDSGSTDRTIEIAENLGAKVYVKEWAGYGFAKKEGVSKAFGKWIISLDADEELSPELAKEISTAVLSETGDSGFYIKRKTNFLGRWIYHCGWYPDYILRLFKKEDGDFNESVVHEKVILNGRVGYLKAEILHYSYNTIEHYFEKFATYTTLGAEQAYKSGKKSRWFHIVFKPPVSFIKHYFIKLGFLDGLEGFIISAFSAMAVMVKYSKLRHLIKQGKSGDDTNA